MDFGIFWCPNFSWNFGVLSHKDGTSPLKLALSENVGLIFPMK